MSEKSVQNNSQTIVTKVENNSSKSVSKKRKTISASDNSKNFEKSRDSQTWTRLTGAPAWDLPPNESQSNQTFTGRCRLFVANLPQNVTEESLRALFGEFGQISDIYIGKGNQFAFVKVDTRANAEKAKHHLDGKLLDGRTLRVRLAAHAAAIRVSNLPPLVSNELLHLAFSSFGSVERAIVSADDRGRSLNEGIVEFARKSSSQAALKKCQNECLILSATPIPVVVTPLESRDEEEGVPEKGVIHSAEYRSEREIGPRFAEQNTIEWEMARKWKQLSAIEQQRREQLELEFKDLREGLKQQMEYLKIEETTKQLQEQLRQMENESQKLCQQREQRIDLERRREEQRRQTELLLRQQEEALLRRGAHQQEPQQDIGQLRRQESELRQQANALQQLLDRQEQALRSMSSDTMIQSQQLDVSLQQQQLYQNQSLNNPLAQLNPQLAQLNSQLPLQSAPNAHPHPHHTMAPHSHSQSHSMYQSHSHSNYGGGGGGGQGQGGQQGGAGQGGGGGGGGGRLQQYNKRNRRF